MKVTVTKRPWLNGYSLLAHGKGGTRIPFFLYRVGTARETTTGEVNGGPGSCSLLEDTDKELREQGWRGNSHLDLYRHCGVCCIIDTC